MQRLGSSYTKRSVWIEKKIKKKKSLYETLERRIEELRTREWAIDGSFDYSSSFSMMMLRPTCFFFLPKPKKRWSSIHVIGYLSSIVFLDIIFINMKIYINMEHSQNQTHIMYRASGQIHSSSRLFIVCVCTQHPYLSSLGSRCFRCCVYLLNATLNFKSDASTMKITVKNHSLFSRPHLVLGYRATRNVYFSIRKSRRVFRLRVICSSGCKVV